jgi:hypothetical protein
MVDGPHPMPVPILSRRAGSELKRRPRSGEPKSMRSNRATVGRYERETILLGDSRRGFLRPRFVEALSVE